MLPCSHRTAAHCRLDDWHRSPPAVAAELPHLLRNVHGGGGARARLPAKGELHRGGARSLPCFFGSRQPCSPFVVCFTPACFLQNAALLCSSPFFPPSPSSSGLHGHLTAAARLRKKPAGEGARRHLGSARGLYALLCINSPPGGPLACPHVCPKTHTPAPSPLLLPNRSCLTCATSSRMLISWSPRVCSKRPTTSQARAPLPAASRQVQLAVALELAGSSCGLCMPPLRASACA